MKTILIIEDNINFLDNLAEFLEIEGFSVIAAIDGNKGFDMSRHFIPDLIICDYLMPTLNGIDVLQLLVSNPKTYLIPIIFSTSMAEKHDILEVMRLGADGYLTKPYQLLNLLEMIKNLIKSGSKRKAIAC